jgi:hypothetical protein
VGDVLHERPPFPCDEDLAGDCDTCNPEKFQLALDAGNCDSVGSVAFPGAREDWLRLLETGMHVVGTGSSDSHEPDKDEAGYPRTFIRAPTDEPAQVRPSMINDAFDKGDVLMTNGPFIRVNIGDVGMGGRASAAGGRVVLHITVDSAPWVRVRTLNVLRGLERVASIPVDKTGRFEANVEIDTPADTFLVVEAVGTDGLFPSIFNNEVPPLQFTDVLGSIGGSFGFGGDVPNALKPALTSVTTPYALTNPIYVDADADGEWTPPRVLPTPGEDLIALNAARRAERRAQLSLRQNDGPLRLRPWVATEAEARAEEARAMWQRLPLRKRITLSRLPPWLWPSNDQRDIRRVLMQFVRHAH